MTNATRLTLVLAIGSFAACAVDDDSIDPSTDDELAGPVVSDEDDDRSGFVAAGGALPTVGIEGGVDPIVDGFSGGRAREPAIAPSFNRFLAVWRDNRAGTSDIFATRIDQDGSIAVPAGLPVATSSADEGAPRVVWLDSGSWLITWTVDEVDIAAATMLPNGTLTQLGTVVSNAAELAVHDLATDGGTALLVYQAGTDIRGTVYRTGTGTFGASFAISDGTLPGTAGTVTGSAGGGFLAAWQSGATAADIRGQLVSHTGTLAGANFDISVDTGVQSAPDAGWDGTNFVATWKSRPTNVWATRVSPTGTVLDVTGTIGGVEIATGTTTIFNPEVGCDTAGCLYAWEDQRDTTNLYSDLYGVRRNLDFTPAGAAFAINAGQRNQDNPAMAPRIGGGQMVVFDDRAVGIHMISEVRVTGAGTVENPNPVLVNRGNKSSQRAARHAGSGAGYLAVWNDSRVFGDDIFARTYDADGVRIGVNPSGLTVTNAAATQNASSLDFDGTNYLAAWVDTRNPTLDIFAARVAEDGTTLDPNGIALSTAERVQTAPAVAGNGAGSLVVWSDRSVPANRGDIVGAFVATNGTFTSFDICRTTEEQEAPAVAWDASSSVFVVTWQDFRGGTDYDVFATRVQADGTVLDGCGIEVAGGAGDQKSPDMAPSGSQLLVVWEDYAADAEGDVYAGRLTASGSLTVLDAGGLAIATGAGAQTVPAVGGIDLGRWSLAWEDWSVPAQQSDIRGNEMSSAGALLGGSYAIANTTDSEHGPHFDAGVNDSNKTYIVYEKTRPTFITKVGRRRITH